MHLLSPLLARYIGHATAIGRLHYWQPSHLSSVCHNWCIFRYGIDLRNVLAPSIQSIQAMQTAKNAESGEGLDNRHWRGSERNCSFLLCQQDRIQGELLQDGTKHE